MFNELRQAIETHKRFVVVSHYRPDGDAIGSTLAMGMLLRAMGKQVTLWNEDPVPVRYAFLPEADSIQPIPPALPEDIDAFICVDSGNLSRLGPAATARFKEAPFTINIDHHATNSLYADVNHVDGGCAACGLVLYYCFIREWGLPLTRPLAEVLYAAISTDTGSFQYPSTTPETMRIGAELLEAGVDVGDMNRRLYQEKPYSTFVVTRDVLNNMAVEENGMLSHYSMPAGRRAALGAGLDDTKDLVDIIRVLSGVKVAAIFEDMEDGVIRISLRSKDPRIDVSQVALQFGGGGHCLASGIRMKGTLESCREKVLDVIRTALRQLS